MGYKWSFQTGRYTIISPMVTFLGYPRGGYRMKSNSLSCFNQWVQNFLKLSTMTSNEDICIAISLILRPFMLILIKIIGRSVLKCWKLWLCLGLSMVFPKSISSAGKKGTQPHKCHMSQNERRERRVARGGECLCVSPRVATFWLF